MYTRDVRESVSIENIIIVVLVALLCITITLLILRSYELKNITKRLEEINDINTNQEILLKLPDKTIEALVYEVNKSIKIKKETESKYKEMDAELRQAIANMSHDLRTPLTSIMGYVQLVKDDNTSEEERITYLDVIEKRSGSLKGLITSFYDLSRLQANEYDLDLEKVNISLILCGLIASFYEDFNNKGLEPVIEIDKDIGRIIGDKQAINRIFTNLIQNVLKHATGQLEIRVKDKERCIITEFINEAPQLLEEDAPRIFERFFTADRMRTGQNTGLGLAITKTLIEKQGHNISAEKDGNKLVIRIIWKK